jgi:glucose/arabinose dehydrogenase
MPRVILRWAPFSLTALALVGCTAPPPADAGSDGRTDATPPPDDARGDVATTDGGAPDSSTTDAGVTDAGATDAGTTDAGMADAGPVTPVDRDFCASGREAPGLRAPDGFCVRKYSDVRVARVMALAPNGDLFVAAPQRANATGISGGPGSIVVLHDDQRDGVIEESVFATGLADVHGIVFDNDWLYFTNDRVVIRTPYTRGQRVEASARREFVIGGLVSDGAGGMREDPLAARLSAGGRQTHGLARSVSGRLFVTRGEYSSCSLGPGGVRAVGTGEVYALGMRSLTRVLYGFRNPMYARCHFSRDLCVVAELGEDQTTGAIEKLLVIPGEEAWFGYPCCHQRGVGPQASAGGCNDVRQEEVSIPLGDTPFGFDWERGRWPEPYRNGLFVALHGSFYTGNFGGSGVVYLPTDPATGVPRRQSAVRFIEATNGQPTPTLQRPTDVVFSPDGRMFVSDDYGGGVYMVAPRFTR